MLLTQTNIKGLGETDRYKLFSAVKTLDAELSPAFVLSILTAYYDRYDGGNFISDVDKHLMAIVAINRWRFEYLRYDKVSYKQLCRLLQTIEFTDFAICELVEKPEDELKADINAIIFSKGINIDIKKALSTISNYIWEDSTNDVITDYLKIYLRLTLIELELRNTLLLPIDSTSIFKDSYYKIAPIYKTSYIQSMFRERGFGKTQVFDSNRPVNIVDVTIELIKYTIVRLEQSETIFLCWFTHMLPSQNKIMLHLVHYLTDNVLNKHKVVTKYKETYGDKDYLKHLSSDYIDHRILYLKLYEDDVH